eukprot:CAMPEP_0116579572 /NCGR_PEP_ID=MMETSP0397-20121206/22322_1 /TAXON_ID=216820 /ORGANISM="Cyclophora tenuis, Strain ECT3854" /LENGTH=139 /DNA_ID=CAMNT_0004109059 /DNA_START=245 /DNA_END=664 /DNA_ORIENTATION=-
MPRIILEAYSETGFDVSNVIEKVDESEAAPSGSIHMTSSIMVFPNSCFLWNVDSVDQVTIESLTPPAILYRPKLQYLFLGSDVPLDQNLVLEIKTELREKAGIVFEQVDVASAMGTFNILNAEDRQVATALVLEQKPDR